MSKTSWTGLPIERRSFLGVIGAGLCTGQFDDSRAELDYEAFLAEVQPVLRALLPVDSRRAEDRYLLTLAAHAVRLRDVPLPEMRDNTADKTAQARTSIGANDGGDPFVVLHWKMDPGARIEQHPHLYGNVVTLVLEGSVRITNYEMVEEPDFAAKGCFPVRRVHDQVLFPGEVNLVPLEHAYTHGFVAGPDGARGLDLTTRRKEWQPTPTLVLSEEPLDADQAIFEGEWRYRER